MKIKICDRCKAEKGRCELCSRDDEIEKLRAENTRLIAWLEQIATLSTTAHNAQRWAKNALDEIRRPAPQTKPANYRGLMWSRTVAEIQGTDTESSAPQTSEPLTCHHCGRPVSRRKGTCTPPCPESREGAMSARYAAQTDPRPELCRHEDSSYCDDSCRQKAQALHEWMGRHTGTSDCPRCGGSTCKCGD